jgi:hypothetical protein
MYVSLIVVTVSVSGHSESKRNYTKADYCYYCERKFVSSMRKHVLAMHTDRSLVQQIVTSTGPERKTLLYKLQHLGNYRHNCQVTRLLMHKVELTTSKFVSDVFIRCTICFNLLNQCYQNAFYIHLSPDKLS